MKVAAGPQGLRGTGVRKKEMSVGHIKPVAHCDMKVPGLNVTTSCWAASNCSVGISATTTYSS